METMVEFTLDGKNVATLDDAAAANVRRRVEARGLFVSAVASPLFKCALDPNRPVASVRTSHVVAPCLL